MLTDIFQMVLAMSAVGGAMGIILLCLSPVMRKKVSASMCYYAWLSPILLMLVPISFKITRKYDIQRDTAVTPQSIIGMGQAMQVHKTNPLFWVAIIWICTAVLLFCAGVVRYTAFKREMRKISVLDNTTAELPPRLEVRRTSVKISPMLIGLARPFLLLPENLTEPEQLDFVIRHEMIHYRRADILVRLLAAVNICIHWFNPVSYVIFKNLSEECEISCDCAAVQNLSNKERKHYMNTVLDLLENMRGGAVIAATQMSGEKRILKRRIKAVKEYGKKDVRATAVLSTVLGILILLCACASGMANGEYILVPNNSPITNTSNTALTLAPNAVQDDIVSETDVKFETVNDTSESVTETAPTQKSGATKTSAGFESRKAQSSSQITPTATVYPNQEEPETTATARTFMHGMNGRDGSYSYKENGSNRQNGVVCDSEGRIAISLSANTKSVAKITFFDSETQVLESVTTVPVSEGETYVFDMTDSHRLYDVEISSGTGGDWVVEGEYTIW